MVPGDMDNIGHRAVIRYLGFKGFRSKKIINNLVVTLGENDPFIQHGDEVGC